MKRSNAVAATVVFAPTWQKMIDAHVASAQELLAFSEHG
jgi:hypothetical protein